MKWRRSNLLYRKCCLQKLCRTYLPCGHQASSLTGSVAFSVNRCRLYRNEQISVDLSSGWPLERDASSFAHRFHRLLNGEQLGRMGCFEMPWTHCCHRDSCGSHVIGGFIECDPIVLSKAKVEADHPSTKLLDQFSARHTAVLRVLRHRCQSFGGVRELHHVKRHDVCLLCVYCFFAHRKCEVKAEIQRSRETRVVHKSGFLSASISA